ncbi:hypothetical protein, partial [Lichenifustis flavocetrariae]
MVEKLKNGDYRVYPGSTRIMQFNLKPTPIIFCGFERPQFLPTEWAQAGFEYKTLYTTLPDPTPLENSVKELSAGFADTAYELARSSMMKRGFTPVKEPAASVDRCSPGLEPICDTYAEATCQSFALGKACGFHWRSNDGHDIVVTTTVGYVSA